MGSDRGVERSSQYVESSVITKTGAGLLSRQADLMDCVLKEALLRDGCADDICPRVCAVRTCSGFGGRVWVWGMCRRQHGSRTDGLTRSFWAGMKSFVVGGLLPCEIDS